MKLLGGILIGAGVLALVYGGFTYTKQRTVLEIGSLEAKIDERKSIPIPPIAGCIAIVAGVVLILRNRRLA